MAGNTIAMGVAFRDQLVAGTKTSDDAIAGDIGEYVQSYLATGSAVSLTTATAANVTSISLTAGDWDVEGLIQFKPGASTSVTQLNAGISPTANTLATVAGGTFGNASSYAMTPTTLINQAAAVPVAEVDVVTPRLRVKVAQQDGPVTIYLVANATFTVSTMAAFGGIRARRVR